MKEGKAGADGGFDANAALGAAVKQLREQAGLTQGAVAGRAGLDQRTLVELEAGRLEPTWGDLRRIAYALEVALPELLSLTERLERGG